MLRASHVLTTCANVVIAKLEDVTKILTNLKTDLDSPKLSPQRMPPQQIRQHASRTESLLERRQQLEQLKVYGRDPTNADPIFTQDV